MSNRDFIDNDLIRPRSDTTRDLTDSLSDAVARARGAAPVEGLAKPVSDIDLLDRQNQINKEKSAQTMHALERLRVQQEELEREKRDLDESRKRQSDYEKGKRELVERLTQSLVSLERKEVKLEQAVTTIQSTRQLFHDMLNGISEIRENDWPEDRVRDEMVRALAYVDQARMEYNKAMAKIEILQGPETEGGLKSPMLFEDVSSHADTEKSFMDWFLIGVAVTLPLVITLLILWFLNFLHGQGWM